MFGPLLHITLIMQLFKIFDNIWKIIHTDISNGTPCLFVFLWPHIGLDTQRGNQQLSWSSQIIFCIWICDYRLSQTTKFQLYEQGDAFLTILNPSVFPNIFTTTNFHVHRCELTKCELFLPERLLSGATTTNRQWC